MEIKKIYRSDENKIIAGIFGGLGEYLKVDPVVFRLLWILISIFTGLIPGIIAYLLAIIIIPKKIEQELTDQKDK